jgi:hypothetical protein
MNSPKRILQLVAVGVVAGLSMGNQGCEQTPVEGPRELKRIVEVAKISAQPVIQPNGKIFDLEFVMNIQFPDVLVSSKQYAVINKNLGSDGSPESISSKILNTDGQKNTKLGAAAFKAVQTKEAECLINLPQWRLGGAVNSYELVAGGGLRVGYTPAGPTTSTSISGEVKFQKSEMDLTLKAFHPFDKRLVEAANIKKDQIDGSIAADINFGLISIGPEYWFKKGLASVAREAMEKGIKALKALTDKREWYSRIIYYEEEFPVVRGGVDVGMKKGDKFTLHNSRYYWDSENGVCNPANYQGSLDGPAIATAEVIDVGDYVSLLKIDESSMTGNEDPKVGSVIKVKALATDATK